MKRRALIMLAVLSITTLLAVHALAWHAGGHEVAAEAAVNALPGEVPAFFRDGGRTIAQLSSDPDCFKNKALPQLTPAEDPEHYIDWEWLNGRELPATRFEYYKLLAELKREPREVGTLPYALAEWTQRLTLAFAEYRRFPSDPAIQSKTLVYGGLLAHYAGDAGMPLHVTLDHDGRAKPDGSSPRTGIHGRVDHIIEFLNLSPFEAAKGLQVKPYDNLMAGIVEQIKESRSHIDETYKLADKFPRARDNPKDTDPAVVDFAKARLRASSLFIARLYLTAWINSAGVELPDWEIQARGGAAEAKK